VLSPTLMQFPGAKHAKTNSMGSDDLSQQSKIQR